MSRDTVDATDVFEAEHLLREVERGHEPPILARFRNIRGKRCWIAIRTGLRAEQEEVLQEALRQIYVFEEAFRKMPLSKYRNAAARGRAEFLLLRKLARIPARTCARLLREKTLHHRYMYVCLRQMINEYFKGHGVPRQKMIEGQFFTIH